MAGFFENMWPDGGKGFGAAAGEFAPMLMSMGAAMQQGQSPFAGAQYGLSQMMAMDSTEEDKRRWEEEMELRRNADARAAASAGRAGAGRAKTEAERQAAITDMIGLFGGGGGGGATPMSPMAAALAGNGGPTRAAGAALDAYSAGNDLRRMGGPYAGFSGGGDLGQSPDALTGADTITGAAGDDMLSAPIYDGEFAAWNDLTEAPKAAPREEPKQTPQFNPIQMPQQQAKPRIDPERAARIIMSPHIPAEVKKQVLSMAFPQASQPDWQRYEAGDGSQWLYDQKNPNNKMQLSPAGGKPSAKDEQIERLVSTGIDRDIAIGIADGAIVVSRDPTTGEAKLVNKGDFERQQPPAPQGPPPAPTSGGDPLSPPDFGAARDSFGAEGFVKGILNTGADALQLGTPFPEVQQTQRDLDVLGETLINDISSAYNRQPPSWLLKNIQELVPSSGNPFKGPEDAKARFRSIGSSISAELRATNDALNNRALSPKTRQDLEARAAQLQGAVGKIRSALQGFDGGGGGNTTKSGVKWRIVE